MLDHYFSYQYTGNHFELFSFSHLFMLVFFIVLVSIFIIFKKKLRKYKEGIRKSLVLILVFSEGSLNIWYVTTGAWNVKETLPLQLCTLSLFFCIIMLITRSYKWFEVVYFIGIGGAVQALLTPELYFDFPHYRYFHFFIAHIAIILSCLYMVLLEKYKPTMRSVWKSILVLNIIAVPVFIINKWLDANYMFLAQKPEQASLLDILPNFPWYIIYLEIIAFFIFIILYFPLLFIKKSSRIDFI